MKNGGFFVEVFDETSDKISMKCSLLIILLLPSLSLAAQSICENAFLLNHHRENLRKYDIGSVAKFSKYNKNLLKSDDLEAQFYYFIDQFHYNINIVQTRRTAIYDLIEKQQDKGAKIAKLLNEKLVKKFNERLQKKLEDKLNKKIIGLMKHQLPYVKAYNKLFTSQFDKYGIKYKLAKRKFGDDKKLIYQVIELLPDHDSPFRSIRLLSRYRERFNIETASINFFKNLQLGSLGFLDATKGIMDLGPNAFKGILIKDSLSYVTKHELKHANFEKMRKNGRESVFHTDYTSTGLESLSSITDVGYRRYMSAEELYNSANNMFWASKGLHDVSRLDPREFRSLINNIYEITYNGNRLVEHGQEVVEYSIKSLKELIEVNVPKGEALMFFADASKQATMDPANLKYVMFIDPAKSRQTTTLIDQAIQKDAKVIIKESAKTMDEFNEYIAKNGNFETKEEAHEVAQKFLHAENLKTQKEQVAILKHILKKEIKLKSYLDKLSLEGPLLLKRQKDLIFKLQRAMKKNPEFYKKPSWVRKLREYRQDIRKFGDLVKEFKK